jgi:hypothetical protein
MLKEFWFSHLGFQGKLFMYYVISLSFTFLAKSVILSSTRFSVEVYFPNISPINFYVTYGEIVKK